MFIDYLTPQNLTIIVGAAVIGGFGLGYFWHAAQSFFRQNSAALRVFDDPDFDVPVEPVRMGRRR